MKDIFYVVPRTFFLYSSGLWRYKAAASPFNGSKMNYINGEIKLTGIIKKYKLPIGLGYVKSCGRKDSNIFDKSYNAVQAWLITSKHTVPDTSSIFGW